MENALDFDAIEQNPIEDNVFAMAQLAIAFANIRYGAQLGIAGETGEHGIERAQINIGLRRPLVLLRVGVNIVEIATGGLDILTLTSPRACGLPQ